MYYEYSHCVALVGYGNAYLHGDKDAAREAARRYQSFATGRVGFSGAGEWRLVATSLLAGFEHLEARGCRRLRMATFTLAKEAPRQVKHALPSGGFCVLVRRPESSLVWRSVTAGHDLGHSNSQFAVLFKAIPADPAVTVRETQASLESQIRELTRVYKDVAAFSERQGHSEWERHFSRGIATLRGWIDEFQEEPLYHHLLPEWGYSEEARRLLVASCRGCQGGDGIDSWFDQRYSDREIQSRYEQLTSKLYQSMGKSIVVAANSFDANTR